MNKKRKNQFKSGKQAREAVCPFFKKGINLTDIVCETDLDGIEGSALYRFTEREDCSLAFKIYCSSIHGYKLCPRYKSIMAVKYSPGGDYDGGSE